VIQIQPLKKLHGEKPARPEKVAAEPQKSAIEEKKRPTGLGGPDAIRLKRNAKTISALAWIPAFSTQVSQPDATRAWRPVWIQAVLQDATPAWIQGVIQAALQAYSPPGARGAFPGGSEEQDGSLRGVRVSFPAQALTPAWEPAATQAWQPGEIQSWVLDEIPTLALDEIPAATPACASQDVLRGERRARGFPDVLRDALRVVRPARGSPDALRGALQACWPAHGLQDALTERGFQGALQGETPKPYALGLKAWQRPRCADARHWLWHRQSCRRGPQRHAGFGPALERCGAGFPRRAPVETAGAELRPVRRCKRRGCC
jgi:hypothetical protein